MTASSSNDNTIDNPLKDEGPVEVLMRLTKTAIFDVARECRLMTVTKTNRPKTEASSHISVSGIESRSDELIDGEKGHHDVTPIPARG